MGPEIEIFLTLRDYADGDPTWDARLFQYSNLEVVHPLNDSRTCRFKAPIEDYNADNQTHIDKMNPLEYFVKVIYRGHLIFWGPIIKPIFNFAEGQVEVNAHDMTYYLKKHFVHSWDVDLLENNGKLVTSPDSMWKIIQAAFPSGHDDALMESSAAYLGIRQGALSWALQGGGSITEDEDDWVEVQRGMNLWDLLQQMATGARAPDFNFKPIDRNFNNGWDLGDMVEFRTKGEIGQDKSEDVIWHYGWGRSNLQNFIWEPDGDVVMNQLTLAPSKGSRAVGFSSISQGIWGILEAWQDSGGDRYMNQTQKDEWLRGMLTAYGRPIDTFTIEPMWDQGLMGSAIATPWRYPSGYQPGDRMRVIAKKGRLYKDLVGRCTSVTLTQLNAAENARSQIEMIPEAIDNPDDEIHTVASGGGLYKP